MRFFNKFSALYKAIIVHYIKIDHIQEPGNPGAFITLHLNIRQRFNFLFYIVDQSKIGFTIIEVVRLTQLLHSS
ncbi:hypothetical protein EGY07_09405 [Chryseobacterium indologenes]|nr:hypothetical protein EGY07_09405 [Chryseobacterium indologenes]